MASYLNTPGGKMKVSPQVIDLIERFGVTCDANKEARPSKYIEGGAEYYWFRNKNGELITRITPLVNKKKCNVVEDCRNEVS